MKRRSLRESLKKYVVDTSVLVEYIIRDTVYRSVVEKLFNDTLKKTIELYVTPSTISELTYVASSIYKIASVEKPNEEALNFVEWLNTRVKHVEITWEMAVEAGELRKRFRIALTDCYVIAAAVKLQAKALFLKPEKEMLEKIEELKKLPIAFLAENKIKHS
ncbi:MAG: type II toxin-antitoxin system VapC family toxin [Nitrososphaeria archaeon]